MKSHHPLVNVRVVPRGPRVQHSAGDQLKEDARIGINELYGCALLGMHVSGLALPSQLHALLGVAHRVPLPAINVVGGHTSIVAKPQLQPKIGFDENKAVEYKVVSCDPWENRQSKQQRDSEQRSKGKRASLMPGMGQPENQKWQHRAQGGIHQRSEAPK